MTKETDNDDLNVLPWPSSKKESLLEDNVVSFDFRKGSDKDYSKAEVKKVIGELRETNRKIRLLLNDIEEKYSLND